MPKHPPQGTTPTRRNFIKNGSMMLAGGAIGGSNLSVAQSAHVIGSDTIKIGLIGCGGRGTAATIQALNAGDGGVKLVAMAVVRCCFRVSRASDYAVVWGCGQMTLSESNNLQVVAARSTQTECV